MRVLPSSTRKHKNGKNILFITSTLNSRRDDDFAISANAHIPRRDSDPHCRIVTRVGRKAARSASPLTLTKQKQHPLGRRGHYERNVACIGDYHPTMVSELQRRKRRQTRTRVEGEVAGGKEGGRRNVEQCVRTTPFREPLFRAAWPSTLSISFHKASRPPFNEDNDYDGRTIRRRSCALLLYVSRVTLLLSPLSPPPPLVPSRYLPTRLQSLILPLPYLEPTTYTITCSLSDSLSHFTLLAPFTFLISLFSSLTLRLDSLFLASLLRYRLHLPLSSLFLFASSHAFLPILSPSCSPVLPPALSPLHHHSLLARCRLTRALILPYLPSRPQVLSQVDKHSAQPSDARFAPAQTNAAHYPTSILQSLRGDTLTIQRSADMNIILFTVCCPLENMNIFCFFFSLNSNTLNLQIYYSF